MRIVATYRNVLYELNITWQMYSANMIKLNLTQRHIYERETYSQLVSVRSSAVAHIYCRPAGGQAQ